MSKMRMAPTCLLVLAALLASCPAHAYTYSAWCNGRPSGWASLTKMYRDRCSMPDGSNADASYWDAGSLWWEVSHMMDWNWWYNDSCVMYHGNGRSETGHASRASISGLNGLTTEIYDTTCPWSWSTQHLIETDVQLASDMDYGAEDESLWNWSNLAQGRISNVHEFGHALGLDHAQGLDIMRASTPLPLAGGNWAEPYGDDSAGVRSMYGGTGLVNMFSSAQKLGNRCTQPTLTVARPRSTTLCGQLTRPGS